MVHAKMLTVVSLIAVMAGSAVAPLAAQADGFRGQGAQLQNSKNDMRNAALVSTGVALIGLATHDRALTTVGVMGGIVTGSQYERDRHIQSERQNCGPQDTRYIITTNRGGDHRFDNRGGDRF